MSVYKDEKNGTWRCIYRYTNHSMQRSGSVSEKKKMSLLVTRTFSH